MKLRFLIGALATLALLGAGCARTQPTAVVPATPQLTTEQAPVVETPATEAPTGTTPVAEAPALPQEAKTLSTIHAVTIKGFAYSPAELRVKVGDTVTWTQEDSIQHNVAFDDGSLTGSLLNKGQTFSYTFPVKGTFAYHCTPHPRMQAKVIVE